MDRWFGRVAVVTGASSGIGAAIVKELCINGVNVVGLARRTDKMQEILNAVKHENGKFYPHQCDVTKEEEVIDAFKYVLDTLGTVNILVNNAGITIKTAVMAGEVNYWKQMFDLNVIAIGTVTREFLKCFHERLYDEGYIVNISSVAAHRLPQREGNYVYAASKYAARIVTEGLRLELIKERKGQIKVTNISPGVVDTEIFVTGGWDDTYKDAPKLKPGRVADAVIACLGTDEEVQFSEIIVRRSGEGW